MQKFNEKSLSHMPLAFYYSTMSAFVNRISNVQTELTRLNQMRQELQTRWQAFDNAYIISQKSHTTKRVSDLDKVRDNYAWVIEHVADLWAEKLDEDELNIHGRRVKQPFKDFDFRPAEALVAENAKIQNIEQVFASPELQDDLEAMGLTELNRRMVAATEEIMQLMSQRNEEQSGLVAGEVKNTRDALNQLYIAFLVYLNAVQELQPEEQISLAAQYYNQDLRKVELQLAQSRKGGSVSDKPQSGTDQGDTTDNGQNDGTGTIDSGEGGTDNPGTDNPGTDQGGVGTIDIGDGGSSTGGDTGGDTGGGTTPDPNDPPVQDE